MLTTTRRAVGAPLAVALICGATFTTGVTTAGAATPDQLPVLKITESPRSASLKLALRYGLGKKKIVNGLLNHVDPNVGELPTVNDGAGPNGDDGATKLQHIDPAALQKIKPPSAATTTDRFERTLKRLGLKPAFGKAKERLSAMDVHDASGKLLGIIRPERQLSYQFGLGNVPLQGAGAKIAAAFNHKGDLSQLTYTLPEFKRGEKLQVLSGEVADRVAKLIAAPCTANQPQGLVLDRRLAYWAHGKASVPNQKTIYPSYVYEPSLLVDGKKMDMAGFVLPAVNTDFGITAEATATGRHVVAKANVTGGRAPYTYEWSSCTTDLPDGGGAQIEYDVNPREAITQGFKEEVVVKVTDADGLVTVAKAEVDVPAVSTDSAPQNRRRSAPLASASSTSTVDVGAEYILNLGGLVNSKDNAYDFVNGMKARANAATGFVYGDNSVFESDFTDSRVKAGGNDTNYVDNVDLLFYEGHGSPGGFQVATGDKHVTPNEVRWGDHDAEWIALMSCSVLAWESGGQNVVQRWGQAFDGLHMLLGFGTTAYDMAGHGSTFAMYLTGLSPWISPQRVRDAWFATNSAVQPDNVLAGYMTPIGPNGSTTIDDYFHGKGSQGPDVRAGSITGWAVYYRWS